MNGPFSKAFSGCKASPLGLHLAAYTHYAALFVGDGCHLFGCRGPAHCEVQGGSIHRLCQPSSGPAPRKLRQKAQGARPPNARRVQEESACFCEVGWEAGGSHPRGWGPGGGPPGRPASLPGPQQQVCLAQIRTGFEDTQRATWRIPAQNRKFFSQKSLQRLFGRSFHRELLSYIFSTEGWARPAAAGYPAAAHLPGCFCEVRV